MESDELDQKLANWLDGLDEEEMICFQCKEPAKFIYAPEDMSWGPKLVCERCNKNFDSWVKFSTGDADKHLH